MSDLLAAFSIVIISLAAITVCPLASITHTCGVCAACGLEFLLAKPSTRISLQLARLFSFLVGRILRLFILQATVSCKCSSKVAKKKVVQKSGEEDVYVGRSTAEASAVLIYERYHTRLAVRKYLV
jgi:hypothetical protein